MRKSPAGQLPDSQPKYDGIVKSRFKDWIPAPRLRGDRLGGYDVCGIYLILIVLLSFPRRRESSDLAQGGESIDVAQDREPVERRVEPLLFLVLNNFFRAVRC